MTEKTPIEVPYLPNVHEIINRHMAIVDSGSPPTAPSINDELELLVNLMGMSRLIEHNMRVAYEKFNIKAGLNLPARNNFQNLINNIEPYINEKNKLQLLHSTRLISNGLVHADFAKVYLNTQAAYDIEGLEFDQKGFNPPVVMFQTTITSTGLKAFVKGNEVLAYDGNGNEIPVKILLPDGTNEIDIDFKYFYLTGTFGFTWDVLKLAYSESVVFMRDMKKA